MNLLLYYLNVKLLRKKNIAWFDFSVLFPYGNTFKSYKQGSGKNYLWKKEISLSLVHLQEGLRQ
jgi:hypothetical protein